MKKIVMMFLCLTVVLTGSIGYAAVFTPGTYEGTGKGYGEKVPVTVQVTVDENKITAVTISGSEEIPFGQMNFDNYSKALTGRTDGDIDAIAGATMTRDGIREAVEAALSKARVEKTTSKSNATLKDGKYTASAMGMDGEVKVEVTISDNKIQSVKIEDNETAGVGDKALSMIANQVIEHQSLAVDSISGATVSSAAMKSALEDVLKQAGADLKDWRSRTVPVEVKDEEFTYDVVVVGAGYAGIQAALKASLDGAKVALLEKLGIVGGTSIFSSGAFVAAFTKEEVPEKIKIWLNRNTEFLNKIDREKLTAAMENAPEIIALYSEMGIHGKPYKGTGWGIDASEKAIKNASTVKLADVAVHAKGGEYLLDTLMKRLEKNGVDVFVNTPATGIITTDGGAVSGVICNTKNGVKTFHAKAVILATGTFARNFELAKELDPGSEYNFTAASKGDEGDGIIMARKLGAVLYPYQHKMSGIFAPDPYDMPVVGQPSNSYPFNCLLVTSKAERKVSETAGSHFQTEYFIEANAPDFGWVVMDQAIADRFLNLKKYLDATEKGSPYIEAYRASSLEELAQKMKVDAAALVATVNRYNELCKAGRDDDFGKDPKYLDPIDDGTYYAVKEYDLTRGEYGGIVTNAKAQVIDKTGQPIKGLYAAGLISSGELLGDFYPGMEALGICSYMGFIAGREAAMEATAR